MYSHHSDQLLQMETTSGYLLLELQKIWDEIGEPDVEKDKMLVELEQECLEVYRRKVDRAKKGRAQLLQAIADSEAELAHICSAMGERAVHRNRNPNRSLKEELKTIIPQLEEMRKTKIDRKKQFADVLNQLQNIKNEICESQEGNQCKKVVDEENLSLKRLEELHGQLIELQNDKSNRLKLVLDHLNTINSLCMVLGMDSKLKISEIHPTLNDSKGPKNISNDTIKKLATTIQNLREVKIQRMQRIQDLATTMLELWNLMDTPITEQQMFQNVTSKIASLEHEITEPDTLSPKFISQVEAEVSRLEQLKSSKMKEVFLKKRLELEDMCRRTHMVLDAHSAMEYSIEAIDSGTVDPTILVEQIELQIAKVKEEAFSRTEILDKVEKWLTACEEECWLEEYNRDDNRYNAGRGAHLTLKRAEKARVVVNKIPAMAETLILKATTWEKERGVEFSYDGVRLISMIEQYNILKQEKEQEKQRQRDQKKLQGQLMAEQEALFGSKPSPSKSGKKVPRVSMGGSGSSNNKRFSLGGAMLQSAKPVKAAAMKKGDCLNQNNLSFQKPSGCASLSTGKRNSGFSGKPVKKQPLTPLIRKPLSPVSYEVSSKVNIMNFLEDQNRTSPPERTSSSKKQLTMTTPLKLVSVDEENRTPPPSKLILNNDDEENKTPKMMPIPAPNTPSTVSAPMMTAISPCVPPFGGKTVQEIAEEFGYSFEERRACFVPKSVSQV